MKKKTRKRSGSGIGKKSSIEATALGAIRDLTAGFELLRSRIRGLEIRQAKIDDLTNRAANAISKPVPLRPEEHSGRPAPGNRGLFDYAEITDVYGSRITVRNASVAGVPSIWLLTKNMEGQELTEHMGKMQAVSPLLDARAATLLRDAIDRFLGDTRLEPRKPKP